jgi:hypothetical protein
MSTNQISLKDVKINELPEFLDAKKKQEQLVKDNPYVAIVDTTTYEAAKRSRTALVGGRTNIQNQDKAIASALKGLRGQSKDLMNEIIAISQPLEIKQQEEVSRYEDEKKAKKEEEARIERERVDGIKKLITDFRTEYIAKIEKSTLESIEDLHVEIVEAELDVFEYDDTLEECKDDLFTLVVNKKSALEKAEVQRLAEVKLKEEQEELRLQKKAQKKKEEEEEKVRKARELQNSYEKILSDFEINYTKSISGATLENIDTLHNEIISAKFKGIGLDKVIEDTKGGLLTFIESKKTTLKADAKLVEEKAVLEQEKADLAAAKQKIIDDEVLRKKKERIAQDAAILNAATIKKNKLFAIDHQISIEDCKELSDEAFQVMYDSVHKDYLKKIKEQEKQDAIKAEKDEKARLQKIEDEKIRIAALRPDIEKLNDYLSSIELTAKPELATESGIMVLEEITRALGEYLETCKEVINGVND